MIITFTGNCASETVTLEAINSKNGNEVNKATVQIAVNRGMGGTRYDFLMNKDMDADFYSCVLFDKVAEAFVNYYKKGRPVTITGRLLINEFITKKESSVIINPQNPVYNLIRPYITDANCLLPDGSVVIGGNYVVKQPVINVVEFSWVTGNPAKNGNITLPKLNAANQAQTTVNQTTIPQAVNQTVAQPPVQAANFSNIQTPAQFQPVNTQPFPMAGIQQQPTIQAQPTIQTITPQSQVQQGLQPVNAIPAFLSEALNNAQTNDQNAPF